MICLALTAPTLRENTQALVFYKQWTDIAELRADKLAEDQRLGLPVWLDEQARALSISFILTLRLPADGGDWRGGEDARRAEMLRIVKAVSPGTLARIDLEEHLSWPDVETAAAKKGIGEIRSFHDFSGTPEDLLNRMRALRSARPRSPAGPVVAKAAVMANGSRDLLRVVQAATQLGKEDRAEAPFILLAMGAFGAPTRILAPLWGAWLSFTSAALPGHPPAAPGHTDPKTLAELYRYKTLNRETLVYGIAGNPVAHSKSPAFHNPRLRAAGLNACYVPFLVDDMAAFLELAGYIDLRACSVTIPHKESAARLARAVSESAALIGACNTLVREQEGWFGTNTDAPGFYEPLKQVFPGVTLRDRPAQARKALVIGAGGAARGIVVALLENGFDVCILNRTPDRAERLAGELNAAFPGRIAYSGLPQKTAGGTGHSDGDSAGGGSVASDPGDAARDLSEVQRLCALYGDLIVQTSSMGMEGEFEHEDPLWFYEFSGRETVYDIVYTPPRTVILERAEKAGCRILNGEGMFEQQALLQLELFVAAGRRQ